jgi:hypothetical protein
VKVREDLRGNVRRTHRDYGRVGDCWGAQDWGKG